MQVLIEFLTNSYFAIFGVIFVRRIILIARNGIADNHIFIVSTVNNIRSLEVNVLST